MQCGGIAPEFTVPSARPCPRHLFLAIQAPYKVYLYQAALSLWHCAAGRAGVCDGRSLSTWKPPDVSHDTKILEVLSRSCTIALRFDVFLWIS